MTKLIRTLAAALVGGALVTAATVPAASAQPAVSAFLPVFGPAAVAVSPRAGHLHVTVDDLPWHWADASDDQTLVVVGLPPGPHKILLELALPDHRVLSGQTVSFVVPATTGAHH